MTRSGEARADDQVVQGVDSLGQRVLGQVGRFARGLQLGGGLRGPLGHGCGHSRCLFAYAGEQLIDLCPLRCLGQVVS